jgi:guanylate kinase
VTPKVVILSAPSGGGKTTITKALLGRRSDVGYSVSATTRPPRAGERDGEAYHFIGRQEFEAKVATGEFLEWATYAGQLYGTVRREVEAVLTSGRHVLLDIEINGARQVRAAYPPPASLSVFVVPPSVDELLKRLRRRGSGNDADLQQRMNRVVEEVREAWTFDYLVVNDTLEHAVGEVSAILDGTRAKRGLSAEEQSLLRVLEAAPHALAEKLGRNA